MRFSIGSSVTHRLCCQIWVTRIFFCINKKISYITFNDTAELSEQFPNLRRTSLIRQIADKDFRGIWIWGATWPRSLNFDRLIIDYVSVQILHCVSTLLFVLHVYEPIIFYRWTLDNFAFFLLYFFLLENFRKKTKKCCLKIKYDIFITD